jgi:hypothetical protein
VDVPLITVEDHHRESRRNQLWNSGNVSSMIVTICSANYLKQELECYIKWIYVLQSISDRVFLRFLY